MDSLRLLVVLFAIVSIGFASTLDRHARRRFRRDDGDEHKPRPMEPPEERGDGVEGDMVPTEAQKQILDGDGDDDNDLENPMDKRKGLSNLAKRWPRGIVPYKIGPTATKYKTKIQDAMAEWSRYTCLKFKPKSGKLAKKVGHSDFIEFAGVANTQGCSSFVGYIAAGSQKVNLTDDCTDFGIGTIIHELGHAIGYVHEQSRPDRDDYVTIHLENVPANKLNNFKKFSSDEVITNEIPYDHASIMHYGSHYGSGNSGTTIEVRHLKDRMDMGQRHGLSRFDIKHANIMYECKEVNECDTLNSCENGGTCIDEDGTFHCECSPGFRGLECDLECADDHDDCYYFSGAGDCIGGEYQGWMLINCKKSCGICQPYECKDTNADDQCAWAKEQGYCETEYVDWMMNECQQTCGFCNFCNPAPCLNGGTCSQLGEGYQCTCAEGFVGVNCEAPV